MKVQNDNLFTTVRVFINSELLTHTKSRQNNLTALLFFINFAVLPKKSLPKITTNNPHMKKTILFNLLLLISGAMNAQQWMNSISQEKIQKGEISFFEIQQAFNDYWEPLNVKDGYYFENGEKIKAGGWKQFKRWEWFWESRVDPQTGTFPRTNAYYEFQKYLKENPQAKSPSGNWSSIGPSTTGGGYAGLGRLSTVAFRPGDNTTIYTGAPAGGIWKSTNGGSSWTVYGDENASIGVSDIVVIAGATTASDIVYIATGDRDAGDTYSVGILKSTNGGSSWSSTGLSFTAGQGRRINRLLMDPGNNNILYAATTVGIYKTTNAGSNWSLLKSTNFIDIELNPGNSQYIYGSTTSGDIYRSTNGGSSWSQVLSTSQYRTELAVSANNSSVVYAVLVQSNSGLYGIYKSTNSGASFSQIYTPGLNLLGWDCSGTDSGGQGWYDLVLAVDPNNVNIVFVGGVNTWKSSNGGTSWSISNHWSSSCSGTATNVHADKHFLAYQNGTSTLFECNDGGIYKTTNSGSSWSHLGSGIVNSQMYKIGVAQTVTTDVVCGLQDNGTKNVSGSTWDDVIGGDGMDCAIDYTNANIQYGELYYGAIRRTTNHWSSYSSITSGLSGNAAWVTPFTIDPTTPSTIYIGYQDVFKSTNQGNSWTKISNWGGNTLRSLAVAPSNSNYIYAATYNTLYRTTNSGSTWSNISGGLPTGSASITSISVKNNDPNTIWVSFSGYNSYGVYQSTNGGASWSNISSGLPHIPVNSVIQNKQNTTQIELYAGTDVGVYLKTGGANWVPFFNGLPNAVVTEVEIYYNANPAQSRIRAGTFGRGLWESDMFSVAAAPVADFAGNPLVTAMNQTVSFTDMSTNAPTTWQWSFSGPGNATFVNGSNANSTNPDVQFDAVGFYTVTLFVSNALGNDTEIKNNYIEVTDISYCIPTYTTGTSFGDFISLVQLGSINNSTGALPSPYYEFYGSMSTALDPGTTYGITLSAGTYGSGNNISVWIDYNHDGIFAVSEKLGNVTLGAMPETGTINFTVPINAVNGNTRMRVREVWSNTNFDPCNNYTYGETEDYVVNITGGIELDLTVFLEGPFNGTDMNTDLYDAGNIPISQPYNPALPYYNNNSPTWLYSGTESVGSVPANVVDWVVVQLRDASSAANASSATIIGTKAAFLLSDGSVVDLNGTDNLIFDLIISQNLFVVVFHRNHLGIISANAVTETAGLYTYDFSSGPGQVLGGANGYKDLGAGVWGMVSADGNASGIVDNTDETSVWKTDLNQSGYRGGDFNMSGITENTDETSNWKPNLNTGGQVPGKSATQLYQSYVPK